jgi:cytochrome c biogenesis protein CcmG/thiol:disulfide interchange protein DsbE
MRRALFALAVVVSLTACDEGKSTVSVGNRAPHIDAASIVDGERVMSPASGGYLVNFWGSWCEPCKRELPRLAASGVPIVGVAVHDSARRAREQLAAVGATWPSANDPDDKIAQQWGVASGFPVTFAVGGDGKIRKKHFGELSDADVAALVALIRLGR